MRRLRLRHGGGRVAAAVAAVAGRRAGRPPHGLFQHLRADPGCPAAVRHQGRSGGHVRPGQPRPGAVAPDQDGLFRDAGEPDGGGARHRRHRRARPCRGRDGRRGQHLCLPGAATPAGARRPPGAACPDQVHQRPRRPAGRRGHRRLRGDGADTPARPALHHRRHHVADVRLPRAARHEDAGAAHGAAQPHGAAHRRDAGGARRRGASALPLPAVRTPATRRRGGR